VHCPPVRLIIIEPIAPPPFSGPPVRRIDGFETVPSGSRPAPTAMVPWHQETGLDDSALGMGFQNVIDPPPDLGEYLDAEGHQLLLEFLGDRPADQNIHTELGHDPLAVGTAQWMAFGERRFTADDVNDKKPSRHIE
jgi:hypothetical protein